MVTPTATSLYFVIVWTFCTTHKRVDVSLRLCGVFIDKLWETTVFLRRQVCDVFLLVRQCNVHGSSKLI